MPERCALICRNSRRCAGVQGGAIDLAAASGCAAGKMNSLTDLDQHQRSQGRAQARFAVARGSTRLERLHQQGSAKLIVLPGPEAVFLNTSGGLTGGDRLELGLTLGSGARVTATTQTAERVYRAASGSAAISVGMELGAGAHLDWLPQETILFDRAAARRRTQITLAEGATCLMCESVVLGRAAMGERVHEAAFTDWRLVQRDGRPLHLEALTLDAARLAAGAAGLADARAFATLVLVAPDAGDALGRARAVSGADDVQAAAAALPGRLVVRMMAADGWPLRRALMRVIRALRPGPLPRVWQI